MPAAVLALTAGAFGIGTTEFIIMGLLLQVAADMHVSVPVAGLLISGYALGVFVGAPVLTLATRRMPRKTVLLALMAIFTIGNAACALAPNYELLMAARVLTSLAHGTFFGVGSVVATSLVAEDKRASAISTMFIGLTVATLLGVPFGAWFGLMLGWRAAFWAVTVIGVVAFAVVAALVPGHVGNGDKLISLAEEVSVLGRPQVLLGLAMTVFGFAGLFVVITYVQPILTRFTGFSEAAVSPILLVFGVGLAIGNVGWRQARRSRARARADRHARRACHRAAWSCRRAVDQAPRHCAHPAAWHRRVRNGRAAPASRAGSGRLQRPDARLEPQHRRVQSRQRAWRLGGRSHDRPRARPLRTAAGRGGDYGGRPRAGAVEPPA